MLAADSIITCTFIDWIPRPVFFRGNGSSLLDVYSLSSANLRSQSRFASKTLAFEDYLESVQYCVRPDGLLVFRLFLLPDVLEHTRANLALISSQHAPQADAGDSRHRFLSALLDKIKPTVRGDGSLAVPGLVLERLTAQLALEISTMLKEFAGHRHCFHDPASHRIKDEFLEIEPVRLSDEFVIEEDKLVGLLANIPSDQSEPPAHMQGLSEVFEKFEFKHDAPEGVAASLSDLSLENLCKPDLIAKWPCRPDGDNLVSLAGPLALFQKFAGIRDAFMQTLQGTKREALIHKYFYQYMYILACSVFNLFTLLYAMPYATGINSFLNLIFGALSLVFVSLVFFIHSAEAEPFMRGSIMLQADILGFCYSVFQAKISIISVLDG